MARKQFYVAAPVWGTLLAAAFCLLCLAGCGSQSQSKPREQSNLKPLSIFFGQYRGQHRGEAPASEAEFKAFLGTISKEQLASFGVQDVNSLFLSTRDQKPYVILYGDASKNNPPGPAGFPVVAYEQEGVGGKRFVASSGAVQEVDEAEFKRLVPGAKGP